MIRHIWTETEDKPRKLKRDEWGMATPGWPWQCCQEESDNTYIPLEYTQEEIGNGI